MGALRIKGQRVEKWGRKATLGHGSGEWEIGGDVGDAEGVGNVGHMEREMWEIWEQKIWETWENMGHAMRNVNYMGNIKHEIQEMWEILNGACRKYGKCGTWEKREDET